MGKNTSKNKKNKKNVIIADKQSQAVTQTQRKAMAVTWPPEDAPDGSPNNRYSSSDIEEKVGNTIEESPIESTSNRSNELFEEGNKQVLESPIQDDVTDTPIIEQAPSAVDHSKIIVPPKGDMKDESQKETEESSAAKKNRKIRPATVSLEGKSEPFKSIIDIALMYEKLEDERKKLKAKNKTLTDDCKKLKDSLAESEKLCADRLEEIKKLKSDVDHRNEVIDIVKADKNESAQEYKNMLGAALRIFYNDFQDLNAMEMNAEIGAAMADTLNDVFEVLQKNGIIMS